MARTLEQRYVLEAEIAAGAAGTVWRARDLTTGTPVAVKRLHPSVAAQPDVVEAFREEARVLGELRHPGVVRPREFVQTSDGTYALVMDLVAGRDLRRLLLADGPLAPAATASVLAQVASALAAVHAAGIVHGDVKPGNILVPEPAGAPGVRLVDFGVAHRIRRPATATHATPEYVAPEVVAGRPPVPASDVYGIGVVAYEALSGRSPFRGGSVDEVLRRHHGWTVAQLPGVPQRLWDVIDDCLALDPAARPDAAELANRLASVAPELAGLPPVTVPSDAPTLRPRSAVPADGDLVSLDTLLGTEPAESSQQHAVAAEPTPLWPSRDTGQAPVPVAAEAPWRTGDGPAHRSGGHARLLLGIAAGVVLLALLGLGGWALLSGGTGSAPAPAADHQRQSAGASPSAPSGHSASPRTRPSSPAPTPSATRGDGGQRDDGAPGTDDGPDGSGDSGAQDGSGAQGGPGDGPGIGGPMPTMGSFGG